jgi:hypothetical protein
MIQKVYLRPWSSAEKDIRFQALLVAVVWFSITIVVSLLSILTDGVFGMVMFAILTLSILPVLGLMVWWSRKRRGVERKTFHMPLVTVVNGISDSFKEKGMPYQGRYDERQQRGPTHALFEVEGSDLRIKAYEQASRYGTFTVVEMEPVTDGNRPVVQSLQRKIDEAFRPRGL